MRIVKNIEDPTVKFKDLAIGEVFLDEDENVCIKVPMVYNEFSGMETESLLEGCMSADDFYDHEENAYCLENNEFFWLDEDEEVRPLKAYLEVK
jgi:hypothetical protein